MYELRSDGKETRINIIGKNEVTDGLAPGVHTVDKKDFSVLRFSKEKFEVPKKLFGTTIEQFSEMVVTDFLEGEGSCGVIIDGEKGNGKTELAQLIMNKLIERAAVPVVEIDKVVDPESLTTIAKASEPVVFYFDEYSKYYSSSWNNTTGNESDADNTDLLLRFFSDKTLGKCLFIITDNEIRNISPFMRERAGRFKYRFQFTHVSEDVVRDICKHYKVSKEVTEYMVFHAENTLENIDNIIAIIKHCIRFNKLTIEGIQNACKNELNVRPPLYRKYYLQVSDTNGLKASYDSDSIHIELDTKDANGEETKIAVSYSLIDLAKCQNLAKVGAVDLKLAFEKVPDMVENKYSLEVRHAPPGTFESRRSFSLF